MNETQTNALQSILRTHAQSVLQVSEMAIAGESYEDMQTEVKIGINLATMEIQQLVEDVRNDRK